MKTLIEHVKVLTMDGENRVYEDGCVLVKGSRIEKVGDRKEAAGWSGGAEAAVLDGRGGILIPGLINTHCHVSMMPFRTLGDDCADRLRRFLFPLENDAMTRRLVYRAARYGICEMLLAGVTTFLDMYYFEDEVAKACEEAGAAAIAVHGRTRVQMYAGKADWDVIRDVKRAVSVPVIANGDVFSGADAAHILSYTGADACMVGRGAFGDPWLFAEINAVLEGREPPERPPLAERMATAVRQVETAAQEKGERLACIEARARLPWYLKGVAYSSAWKQKLVRISTLDELRSIARDIALGRPPIDEII